MTRFRTILSMVALAAALSLGPAMPAFAAAKADRNCLTDQQIQVAIAAGQIKSWPKIKTLAGVAMDYQEVSDVRVCLIQGIPYYTVNVVSPGGEATKIVLNAVDGTAEVL